MNTLKVGDKVPPFTVNDHLGNPQSLAAYKGSKVVVFFYPKANTPGCTAEACDLRDHFTELKQAGYVLLGVSADTEKAQKNLQINLNSLFLFSPIQKKKSLMPLAFGDLKNLWVKNTTVSIVKLLS